MKNAREWIAECIAFAKKKKKTDINFAIDINSEVIGGISLMKIEGHKAELGYWLGKKYWNQGIMTEAIKLITNFGYNKLRLKRIYAYVFSKNKASARVLEKNGYKYEGLLRKQNLKDGKFTDDLLFAKVK